MSALSISEVLSRAADLIELEGAWCQGGSGRDARGRLVRANNIEAATRYCAVGAIWKVIGGNVSRENYDFAVYECFPFVRQAIEPGYPIGNWNDKNGRTQAEVVAKLREAAELAREQGL